MIDKERGNSKICSSEIKIKKELTLSDYIGLCVAWMNNLTKVGDNSAQIGSSGYYAQIGSSGNYAKICSSGDYSVIMCAGGKSKAKAKKGSWITLSEWKIDGEYVPVCVKTEQVDGERIKEDTWYELKDGVFVETTTD